MARKAHNLSVRMRQSFWAGSPRADFAVCQHELGVSSARIVNRAERVDDVHNLLYHPGTIRILHGMLDDVTGGIDFELLPAKRRVNFLQLMAATGPHAAGEQSGALVHGAMAIFATDFDGVGHLRVEVAVAVRVLLGVAAH